MSAERSLSTEIESVGYRPKDNETRWSWMRREVQGDSVLSPLSLEIGSNFGYMSLNFAKAFPSSRVFSIEGSYGTGNRDGSPAEESPGIKKHKALREQFGLNNNVICVGLANNALYESILSSSVFFDYLVCLSVFHWTVDASTRGMDSRTIFGNMLRMAKTTFIELPDMEQGKPLPDIYRKYATIPEAMQKAAAHNDIDVRITYLGSCDWYGTRDTYRVDNLSMPEIVHRSDNDTVIKAIGLPTA